MFTRKAVQVEAYLPTLKQRPDLLIGKIAIEIQCSPLPIKRLVERTETYQTHGYQVVWILGERLVPKDKLTQLTKQFTFRSPWDFIYGRPIRSKNE